MPYVVYNKTWKQFWIQPSNSNEGSIDQAYQYKTRGDAKEAVDSMLSDIRNKNLTPLEYEIIEYPKKKEITVYKAAKRAICIS